MMRLVAPAGVAAALVLAAAAGGAPTWSAPTRLSPADRAIGPELALAENGRATVVWDREVGSDCASDPASLSCVHIVDAVSREPGAAWGQPVELGRPGVGSLPQVAVDSAGDTIVSWIHDIGADRVLQATIRHGPSGSWPNPNDLSVVAERIREHHVALDAAGEAVAAWAELGGGGFYRVEVEVRPSGVWGAPLRLSNPGSAVLTGPSLAVNAAGAAIVAWDEDGKIRVARGSAASGSWEQPVTISTPGTAPRVALDADGNATVVWTSGAEVEAASGTPAGEWEAPVEVSSTPGAPPSDLDLALDRSGNAVAVWLVGRSVYAAARRQAGRWSEARRISPALASDPGIAVAPSGNAVATWTLAGDGVVQAARLAAISGAWESPVDISASGASAPRVAIDAVQSPVVVWNRVASSAVLVEAADLAAGGPVLGPVRFPVRARAGRRAVFSVEPAPWESPLAGPPVWRFGDGKAAQGLRVAHVYRRRGRYKVSVTQRDAAGGNATASATLRVRRR